MNRRKLAKIKRELNGLSGRGLSSKYLQGLARQLGRTQLSGTNEPTFVRIDEPALSPPLSIPHHTRDMPLGTAKNIISMLQSDIDGWEIYFDELQSDQDNAGEARR